MTRIKATKTGQNSFQLDLRGWMCPYPKYALEPLLEKLPAGARLSLLVDCAAATTDVPRLSAARGFTVSDITEIGSGEWAIAISAPGAATSLP